MGADPGVMNKLIASVLAAGTLGTGAFALNTVAPVGAASPPADAIADIDGPAILLGGGCGARPPAVRARAVLQEALDALVADGTLTQAQADAVVAEVREQAAEAVEDRPGPSRRALRHGALEIAAQTIGIPIDELRQALLDGQSTSEVATDHGVSPDAVVDAIVAEGQGRLDEAVANGRLGEDQAARASERLAEKATEAIERSC